MSNVEILKLSSELSSIAFLQFKHVMFIGVLYSTRRSRYSNVNLFSSMVCVKESKDGDEQLIAVSSIGYPSKS